MLNYIEYEDIEVRIKSLTITELKQQATVFQSLMQNYDTFREIRSQFEEGLQFGSSENENAEYIDSIAGRLNHLKSVWTSIGTTVVNSDFIKGMLDGFISLSDGIDTVIQAFDTIGLASSATFGLMGGFLSAIKSSVTHSRAAASGVDDITRSTSRLGLSMSSASGFLKNFIKQGLAIGVVTFFVQGLAKAWDSAKNNLKNTAEELKSIKKTQLDEINASKEKVRVLETIGKEYEGLARKANKSAEEQARMLEIGNELAEVLPEIQIGTDSDGNAIISMTSDMEGYIEKTNEAIEAQERLMLANNRDRADNALELKSKGEFLDRLPGGKGGLDEQALNEQKSYNEAWTVLEEDKIKTMNWLRESEGKDKVSAMNQLQDINNSQLKLEGEHGNRLAEINSKRMEGIDAFRDYANSLVTIGIDSMNDSTPEMKKAALEFTNSLDFSEINTEIDLSNMQRIISELPQMLNSGKINIDNLRDSMGSINEEFSEANNIEKYNSDMKSLAETISKETGWDASTLTKMFTKMDNMLLQSKGTLEDYLNSFGSDTVKLKNGDGVAKALQSQYDSIQDHINKISNMPDNVEKQIEMVVDLKNDKTLPSQIREMVAYLEESKMDKDAILTITAQAMIDWKDGGFDTNSLEFIRQGIETQLLQDGATYEEAVEVSLDIIATLGTMDKESVLEEIDKNMADEKVTKTVDIEANVDKITEIEESISVLESRPDVNKKVQATVDGQEDLIIFKDIIKEFPAENEFTNSFIIDNAEALNKMNSYKEVQEWINNQPREFRQKYGIEVEDESKQKIETLIKNLEEQFGEIPTEVETIIEADGIKAYSEAKNVLDVYNSIPEEVRTVMSNNGMETSTQLQLVDLMLNSLPKEVVLNILNNFPDVVGNASSVKDVIMSLPPSVLLEIQSNYPEVVEKSDLLKEAIDNIPATKKSSVELETKGAEDKLSSGGILGKLFGKDKSQITASAIIEAQVNGINEVKELDGLLGRFGGGYGGSSPPSGVKRSIGEYSINPTGEYTPELLNDKSKATKGGAGGSSGGYNVSINAIVNGIEEIQTLKNILDKFTIEDINANITINTALASKNLSGIILRINQVKSALGTLSSKNVNIITARSAMNLSGLIVRVNQYKSAIDTVLDKTVNVHTVMYAAYIEKSI